MEVMIRKGGIIELPEIILTKLGLKTGKKVDLCIKDHELLIRPVENLTNKITDSLKLNDAKLIEAIVETEDWL
jgi:antitoxin component of MazEF toxin-antitoxin module